MRDASPQAEPSPGHELEERAAGSRLLFVSTRSEGQVRMEIEAPGGWATGPLHVHPRTSERLTVLAGRIAMRVGDGRRVAAAGDVIVVPPAVPHTARALSDVRLRVEFEPPLRTDRLFFEMYGGGGSHPSRRLPAALRAWLESRGYRDEIRYLWPRRLALGVAALAVCAAAGHARGTRP